jgi:putative ABC transport system permease protein
MLRNYAAAALRYLARNQVYCAISVLGLALGLAAATLAGVTLRNELSYEHFIPGFEHTYLAANVATPTGHPPLYSDESPSFVGSLLKLNIRQIEAVTRIAEADVRLKHTATEAAEKIYWADPNALDLLPLPVVAGQLRDALRRSDGIVLTRSVAQKYFGRDDPLGETILVDAAHPMTVTAVVDDLPVSGTTLESGIFASGLAAYSALAKCDRDAPEQARKGSVLLCGRTYVRLAAGSRVSAVQDRIDGFLPGNYPKFPGMTMSVRLMRIDAVHLFDGLNPGMQARLAVLSAVALAILLGSCVVFVNLSTARSERRALEVGVRKACGASHAQLITQFIGEALVYTGIAAGIGLLLADLALPSLNAFLGFAGHLDLASDPALLATIVLGVLLVGVLAGSYPAFVLAAFRPSLVLKGSVIRSGGALARQALVVLQFAILIGLLLAAAVIYQQRIYATREALRLDTDQMLIMRASCRPALLNELRSLPGVRGAYCASSALLDRAAFSNTRLRDGTPLAIDVTALDFGTFGLYGITPLAGTFATHGQSEGERAASAWQVVINEAAARRFGFASPLAAVGQSLPLADAQRWLAEATGTDIDTAGEIIAVVPDFAVDVASQKVRPTVYVTASPQYRLISIKLTGREIPQTLEAIDRKTLATGSDTPAERFFLDAYIRSLYQALLSEAQGIALFAAIAAVLGCLGLLGLSAASAEHRTKEIGVRKAMGASTCDILRMMLWQFAIPILWASVLALPVSAFLLDRWLEGFAEHVSLGPLPFAVAGLLALVIALATVFTHALRVARARPVDALRYE